MRAGIRALLAQWPHCEIVGESDDGPGTLTEVERLRPDVLLLDIAMPGLSGVEIARRLHISLPQMRILTLSGIDRQEVVEQSLQAGAAGYLLKDFILAELQLALGTVIAHGRYVSPKLQARLIDLALQGDRPEPPSLTPRQTEILRWVAIGHTSKEITKELGISPKTVEFHRAQLMDRTGARDVAGLTRYAMQLGLIA